MFRDGLLHSSESSYSVVYGDIGLLTHSVIFDQQLEVFDGCILAVLEYGGGGLRVRDKILSGFSMVKGLVGLFIMREEDGECLTDLPYLGVSVVEELHELWITSVIR